MSEGTSQPTLTAEGGVALRLRVSPGDGPVLAYSVEQDGKPVGTVELRRLGDDRGELTWATDPAHRGRGVATAAVRRLIEYAFTDLGLARVEARVEPENRAALRVAARSGLRLEGRLRAHEGSGDRRQDLMLLARIARDPDVRERDGFIGILNSSLPRKRVIAQALLHDEQGRVLLCELTYKPEWDLPGGVVEPDESPADALVRELQEELGIEVEVRGLRTVNWLPAWAGWDDAIVLVFDLGVADSSLTSSMRLQRTEIKGVHWCDAATVRARATAVTIELLEALDAGAAAYREHGR